MNRSLILSAMLTASMSVWAQEVQTTETAQEAVKNMGLGWNLGNTLDANISSLTPEEEGYWGEAGLSSETCWGQPVTKEDLIIMMKNAGIGAIRVPVTWYNHMDEDGNVDEAWMKRVHTVVDYVIDNDMYCIINVHHDTGADSDSHHSWIKADEENYTQNKTRFEHLWAQIAEEFKDYGDKLLFEGYNEMLDKLNSWCYASFNAQGQYDAAVAKSAYKGLNSYAKSFVETVRATGGNNATRNLIVNTYAAANGSGNWKIYLTDPLTKMEMPEAAGHIIFEVHCYPSIANNGLSRSITEIKRDVDDIIDKVNTHLVAKGAPVIFGEWGTSGVDAGAGATDYDLRRELMLQFCDYFVSQSKANDIATFYWMGLSDGITRSIPAFSQADLAETLAKAYHGSDFEGEYPVMEHMASYECLSEEKPLEWGNGITINSDIFRNIGNSFMVELTYTYKPDEDDIQLFYADWSVKPSFYVDGKEYEGDYNPSQEVGEDGGEKTVSITFDKATNELLLKKGLVIHGNDVTLSKVIVYGHAESPIKHITSDRREDAVYNLQGQRMTEAQGMCIVNGKLVYVK